MNFDIKNKQIIVDKETLMIGALRTIYQRLPEDVAIRALTYIYVASQIHVNAPFFSARKDEIDELSWKNAIYGADDDTKITLNEHKEKFASVIDEYKNAYATPETRMLNVFNGKIDDLRDLVEETKPEIIKSTHPTSGVTSFADNTGAINKVMLSLGSLMETKEKIEAKLRKEAAGRVRAGKKPSRLEKKHSTA